VIAAIRRGEIAGLSAEQQRVLASVDADSLDKAVNALASLGKISAELAEMDNPLRAARDAVNKEFDAVVADFKRFGIDTADAEKLRLKRLEAIINDDLAPITGLISDLTMGSRSGATLDEEYRTAEAEFRRLVSDATAKSADIAAAADRFANANIERNASSAERFVNQQDIVQQLQRAEELRRAEFAAQAKPASASDIGAAVGSATNPVAVEGFNLLADQIQQLSGALLAVIGGGRSAAPSPALPSGSAAGGGFGGLMELANYNLV
jgi:hypothetical protein